MRRKTQILLCAAAALAALTVALYPLVSNYNAEKNRSLVESQYAEAVEKMDNTELFREKEAARAYNSCLADVTAEPFGAEHLAEAEDGYDTLLDINGDGVMGTLEISELNVSLPIYHGTDDRTLQLGAGHLLGSSLPVGGAGTHSVVTGHSGMGGQKLLSDLDRLEKGSIFCLHVLGEDLYYIVDDINTVLPEDTSLLAIDPEKDLCTLVTCTPFGVNTHRLLVRGHRVQAVDIPDSTEGDTAAQPVPAEPETSEWTAQYLRGLGWGCGGVGVMYAAVRTARMVYGIRQRKRRRGKHEKRKT